MRGLFNKIPWWGKLLAMVAVIILIAVFWKQILIVLGIIFGAIVLYYVLANPRNREVRRRTTYYYEEPGDTYIVVNGNRQRNDIQRGMDWHVPRVNRNGAEFITGASNSMKKLRKNLWG
jgi:uncharacterized protein (DUF58 family)